MNVSTFLMLAIKKIRISKFTSNLNISNLTILSQNCIGGVIYHDCKSQFMSPTINLFMSAQDYMTFVENFEYYVSETPVVNKGDKYPIGILSDGLKIEFMHYEECDEALAKWEIRKKRITNNIVILCIERDGFGQNEFNRFKKLPFPKLLFTKNAELKNDPECIYVRKYRNSPEVGDLISFRTMYKYKKLKKMLKRISMI